MEVPDSEGTTIAGQAGAVPDTAGPDTAGPDTAGPDTAGPDTTGQAGAGQAGAWQSVVPYTVACRYGGHRRTTTCGTSTWSGGPCASCCTSRSPARRSWTPDAQQARIRSGCSTGAVRSPGSISVRP